MIVEWLCSGSTHTVEYISAWAEADIGRGHGGHKTDVAVPAQDMPQIVSGHSPAVAPCQPTVGAFDQFRTALTQGKAQDAVRRQRSLAGQ